MVFCCACLNLIALGSSQTVVAIFNITAPSLDLSYVAVIFARRWYAGRIQFIDGPYTLGRWGLPLNTISIIWVLFISVVLFFPTVRPIRADNMNYAVCVAAFMSVFAVGWWWAGARKWVWRSTRCGFVALTRVVGFIRGRGRKILCRLFRGRMSRRRGFVLGMGAWIGRFKDAGFSSWAGLWGFGTAYVIGWEINRVLEM